jgi:catechol 2,3-dioxygenase-like lactoylglutathione lyase family enzyme
MRTDPLVVSIDLRRGCEQGTMSAVRGRQPNQSWGVVLEAPDARELARFYSQLLEWPVAEDEPGWVVLAPPEGGTALSFQTSVDYVRPVWPPAEGRQQMMAHLDLQVEDLDVAVESALETGATLADFQPQDGVRVLLDPAGHPFCLYVE